MQSQGVSIFEFEPIGCWLFNFQDLDASQRRLMGRFEILGGNDGKPIMQALTCNRCSLNGCFSWHGKVWLHVLEFSPSEVLRLSKDE